MPRQGPRSQVSNREPGLGPAQWRSQPAHWAISAGQIDYRRAVHIMEQRAAAIAAGKAPELIWLLEHPALYTAGTSAKPEDLLTPHRFQVFDAGRGGQYTYHGPGQRIAYVMLDVKARGGDLRAFVAALECWLIDTLAAFDVSGERRKGHVGVWIGRPDKGDGCADKIAAIGIRLRKWVSFHGVSLNVDPQLDHYAGIVPCGITGQGVTSLADLGIKAGMAAVDKELERAFNARFGPTKGLGPEDALALATGPTGSW